MQTLDLGPYEILRPLGTGGMAEVMLARRRGTEGFERSVVIKLIHGRLAHDTNAERMFIEEARLAGRLDHPNIARVEDFGRASDGRLYLVMERVGRDLDSLREALRADDRNLPLWLGLHVMIEVLEALDHLHRLRDGEGREMNPVHRDVNPPNILISPLGQVKLADFGVANYAGKSNTTLAGQLKGKLGYMSPEQIQGRPVDFRADLFASGVTLWELLNGRALYAHLDDLAAMIAICEDPRPSLEVEGPDVPRGLEAVVQRALAIDPEDRFGSAREFQAALLPILSALHPQPRLRDLRTAIGDMLDATEDTTPQMVQPGPVHGADDPIEPPIDANETLHDREDSEPEDQDVGITVKMLEPAATLATKRIQPTLLLRPSGKKESSRLEWQEALQTLTREADAGRAYRVSADDEHWLSLEQLEQLLDQAFVSMPASTPRHAELGVLTRACVELFTRLTVEKATGVLTAARENGDWIEVHLRDGGPVEARTNLPNLQLPRRIAGLGGISDTAMGLLVQDSLRMRRPLVEIASAAGVLAPTRSELARARWAILVDWSGADYTFAPMTVPAAQPPLASSLLEGLVPLVKRAWSESRLRAQLTKALSHPVQRTAASEGLETLLGLSSKERDQTTAFTQARTLAEGLSASPGENTALAFVLLECGALTSPS